MFSEKIRQKQSGILLYGITAPKAHFPIEKIEEISHKSVNMLCGLDIDGLVVYDLQDESVRTSEQRPFPFYNTLDPFKYAHDYLSDVPVEKIIYRSVGKYDHVSLSEWLKQLPYPEQPMVFVGAPSKDHQSSLKLPEAYKIWNEVNPNGILGGVTIPERHLKGDEHLKIVHKMHEGCSFFISQCVYNVEYAKNVVSDLYYHCQDNGLPLPTLIFTLTTCGSLKTLNFLNWLGIHVPTWLKNELNHSKDILSKSVDLSVEIAYEIISFCVSKGIPCGLNVESVSLNKEETEASQYLLKQSEHILQSAGIRSKLVKEPVSLLSHEH